MSVPPRRQVNVRLPETLLAEIDDRRAVRGLSRDAFVARALRYALDHAPPPTPQQGDTL